MAFRGGVKDFTYEEAEDGRLRCRATDQRTKKNFEETTRLYLVGDFLPRRAGSQDYIIFARISKRRTGRTAGHQMIHSDHNDKVW